MVKTRFIQMFAILATMIIAIVVVILQIPFTANAANLSKNYTLTGVGASDMVKVVNAQDGYMESTLGYSGLWQVDFLADCAALAGQSSAIPKPSATGKDDIAGFMSSIKNAGGTVVSTPKAGDIVFHYCNVCKKYSNVGIYISNDELNGLIAGQRIIGYHQDSLTGFYIYSYGVRGVVGGATKFYEYDLFNVQKHRADTNGTITYIRPNYTNKMTGLSVLSMPTKTSYYVGDTLNTSGLKLKATYADGSTKTISSGYTTSYDFSSAGTKKVTVTYGGKSTSFNVTVSSVTVSSIAIASNPTKTVYNVGDTLNTSGLKLKVTYSNGTTSTISSGFQTSYDFSSSGTKKVTVTYGGKSTSFNVTVNSILSAIYVTTAPMTLVYENGSAFNPAGMVIKATYNDGTSKNITGYKTSYDFSTVGDKNVTISYTENGVTKSATQLVSVVDLFKGSGTDTDPYQINHVNDLLCLMDQVNNINTNGCYGEASYIQTADIDVGEMPEPIGSFYENSSSTTITNYAAFNGHYNGNYHKLTNFILNNTTRNYGGVFGRTNSNAVIEKLSVSGSINGVGYSVGGIVGELGYGSIVRNCDFSGTVTGKSMVGGIAGKIQGGGTISSCYANADVTATMDAGIVGGIAGYVVVGNNSNSANMVCENSYFAGTVTGVQTGGVCGYIDIQTTKECTVTFSNAYYLNTAASGAVNGAVMTGCGGVYASTLKNLATSLGDVFVNSTEAVNDGYPVFVWQTPAPFAGSGTAPDPYQISSKEDLETMRDLVNNTMTNPVYGNACYIQTADIDLENESWFPIGPGYDGEDGLGDYNYLTRMFYGVYDGNRHTIYNLNVDKTYKSAGLFGVVRGEYAGVINVAVTGNINSGGTSNVCAGGIAGAVHYGADIRECAFIGSVTGNQNAGGIAGNVYAGGTILNCYHTGNVKAASYAGGITGRINFGQFNSNGDSTIIENCYHANGAVTAAEYSGGIAGICTYYDGINTPITIINSYVEYGNAVNVKSSGATEDNTASVSTTNMKTISSFLGEDYVNNTNESLNNGYPVFEWQLLKIRGDIDADGTVSINDIVLLQKYLIKISDLADEEMYNAADLTYDGAVNVFDMVIMKRLLLSEY